MLPGLDLLETRTRSATTAGDPTAFLAADHDWLRGLLVEFRPLVRRPDQIENIRTAMMELKLRLNLHIRREEEAYFPAIEDFMQESGQGSTFDMYGEHDAIHIRLDQLLEALEANSDVSDSFAAFSRSLLIHFENEEELIFAEATAHLSVEASRQVLSQFEALI